MAFAALSVLATERSWANKETGTCFFVVIDVVVVVVDFVMQPRTRTTACC